MINKLKLGLSAVAMLAIFGLVSSAYAGALNWSADQTIDLVSTTENLTILSGSEATSLVVNSGNIVIVLAATDVFTVTSDGLALVVTGNTSDTVSNTSCVSGVTTVVVTGVTGGETITIAPNTECSSGSGGGGGSSGGGGGGSSNNTSNTNPTTPITPAPGTSPVACPAGQLFSAATGAPCTSTTHPVFCAPGQMFNAATGEKCTASVSPDNPATLYPFGTVLVKRGTRGEACGAWQKFFNDKAGANLVVDGNCGPLTMAAAVSWQRSQGLAADGLLGSMSRAKANTQLVL